MGMFASTVFIRNEEKLTKEQIISELTEYMKSKSYIQSDESHAEETYCLAFPDGKWFAMGSSEQALYATAKYCTQIFHAYVMTANLVDSDFVMLELLSPEGHVIDRQTIGTPYWEEEFEEESKETDVSNWISFLKQGITPEDLISALQAQEVFAEDAFGKFGDLIELDTDPLYIEWNEISEEVTSLYFRKK